MSAIIGAVVGAVVLGVLIPAGAKLARHAAQSISNRFDANFGNSDGNFTAVSQTIRPVSKIRTEFKPLVPNFGPMTGVQDAKNEVLSALASSPLYMSDDEGFKVRISTLERSETLEEVRAAASDLSHFLETDHQNVLAGSIRIACERASTRMGFTKFESLSGVISGPQIRFAATDPFGRTLVTEVSAPLDGDVRIDTEVLGVSDDSCHKLLEEFHEALRHEGVDISGPPKRESTGGVCTSAAAREFIASKLSVRRHRPTTSAPSVRQTSRPRKANRKDKRNEIRNSVS